MGSYTEIEVDGYPLFSSKSYAIPDVMTVFRESDKKVFTRNLSDRNPVVWGATTENEDETETALVYETKAGIVCDRLDVMGFTMNRCRADFESIRDAKIYEYNSWWDEFREDWQQELIDSVEGLSFEIYLRTLKDVIRNKQKHYNFDHQKLEELDPVRKHMFSSEDYELGFFSTDYRSLLRVACEVTDSNSLVIQDLTELVHAGYYSVEDDICNACIAALTKGHPENAPRIILTEGPSDIAILKAALEILYPHLVGYYTFPEFSSYRAQGSAGALVNTVKSFAAAGVSNRVIAIFDNDAAALDARRSLSGISLPDNIVVCSYPDLAKLKSYPTMGPSGRVALDVNGLAASIELYLGERSLIDQGGQLRPVQWKGFIEGVSKYQGEVMHKGEIQKAFFARVAECKASGTPASGTEWEGLREIFNVIFHAFE